MQSTISAYQNVLTSFKFIEPTSFSEEFAQKRFKKKMERPDPKLTKRLSQEAWDDWLNTDKGLPQIGLLEREWYIVRDLLHKAGPKLMRHLACAGIEFPKGSEFSPTRGLNSVQSRLQRSEWDVTPGCFNDFLGIVAQHKALKRALNRRYRSYCRKAFPHMKKSEMDAYMFKRAKESYRLYDGSESESSYVSRTILTFKLECVTQLVQGSRFATVPKNNEKRRPINIEGFGNIVVQRRIGNGLRSFLKEEFYIDLDTLAEAHGSRITDPDISTVDCKSASDSISLDLVRFLFPKRFVTALEAARSPFILGPDDQYYPIRKVSSMGNGFTFELMSLILNAVVKVLDISGSVFGDDIIIKTTKVDRLIQLIEQVGFTVNRDKTFVDGPFRESCGKNYHREEGYVTSYDFLYPETIHDCIVIWNKVQRLQHYPSFRALSKTLSRYNPPVLQGGEVPLQAQRDDDDVFSGLGRFFQGSSGERNRMLEHKYARLGEAIARNWQVPLEAIRFFYGLKFAPKVNTPSLRDLRTRSHWAKYEMYLSAGRKAKDIVTGEGEWVQVLYCSVFATPFRCDKPALQRMGLI